MKKAILILFPILALIGIFYYANQSTISVTDIENTDKVPLKIEPNKVQDPQCHMFLSGDDFAVQVITRDLKTHFFDDPGCAILWMEANKIDTKDTVIWAYSIDSKKWIDAKKAYYSISDFQTPMHYGFGVYEKSAKRRIGFEQMRLKMLRGENMTNPKIRKKILSQEGK